MDIDQIFQKGLEILNRNLDAYPAFDPTKPYPDKDKYFEEVSQLSGLLFAEELRVPLVEQLSCPHDLVKSK